MPELELTELVEELLEAFRWLQVLAYSNQFVLNDKLAMEPCERDRILEAATRAVDKDSRLQGWQQRLSRIKSELKRCEQLAQNEPGGSAEA